MMSALFGAFATFVLSEMTNRFGNGGRSPSAG